MRTGVEVRLGLRDRDRLEAIVASRNSPQKHVWRSRIVLPDRLVRLLARLSDSSDAGMPYRCVRQRALTPPFPPALLKPSPAKVLEPPLAVVRDAQPGCA